MSATDANTLIHFFKGMGNVGKRLAAIQPQEFAIPAIVLFELEEGTADSTARREALDAIVRVCRVLPFDAQVAKRAAVIRNELARRGQMIGPLDMLIAATASANGATLITHNTAEFSRVPGLLIEDWF